MTLQNKNESCKQSRLILASGSPRRAALLCEHGYHFEVVIPAVEEFDVIDPSLPPATQAQALSYFKAQSVKQNTDHGWILGGDTIASLDGRIFGKPTDRNDARNILSALIGTTHEVITGVTLLDATSDNRLVQHDTTRITMKSMSDEQIEQYLDTDAWQGKAGAYGIQDHGDAFVERIEGSFTNVVGFPMEMIEQMLQQWGWGC